jgi:peptidoglycan/xylan/chitin deacetylase (PgdA/CDA1 family)
LLRLVTCLLPVACSPRGAPVATLAGVPASHGSAAQPAAPSPPHAIDVAITVDDLPHHGADVPGESRLAIHQAFVAAFRAHHVPPVYGFVIGGQLDAHPEDRAALDAWVASGNPVGNHTRTHPDLHKTTVDAYLADLDANEPLLRELARGADERSWKVFRYPYLQEGTDLASRARIRDHIAARGYRIAQVTVDFYDWAYNAPYARCLARRDEQALAALKKSYLDDARLSLHWADAAARALFGRPVEQILLLHIGAFDALVLDELLTQYERQGVRFVSLEQAMADPIYAVEPRAPRAWEGTFLAQVREARGVDDPPEPNLPEALLGALCR